MFDLIHDTIVAIASPPGFGARGILRVSGPDSLQIVDQVFQSDDTPLLDSPGFRRLNGQILVEPECAVPVELWLFRAPKSYTRQDSIELHLPGSPVVLSMAADALIRLGAREAEPGEFTARAFMNGAMDLTRAEAVANAIHAQSDAQLRAAHQLSRGDLAHRVNDWRNQLTELRALVEADIDFSEEPIEFITPDELVRRLEELASAVDALHRQADSTERLEVLPRALLIGPANAGKSTLLNRLSGLDRAICSAVSGTTRDVLTVPVSVDGFEFLLLDAAGLEPVNQGLTAEAIARTYETAESVDLLVLVEEADGEHMQELDIEGVPRLRVISKIDRVPEEQRATIEADCLTSGHTGEGIDTLRKLIADALRDASIENDHSSLVLSTRHHRCLFDATQAMQQAVAVAQHAPDTASVSELIAFELRQALDSLGAITGEVTTDELFESVFANFCVGK